MSDIRKLKPEEIECRVGIISKDGKGFSLLLYKNARVDMEILDETFGVYGWKRSHYQVKDTLFCEVSIFNKDIGEWVSKSDAGSESNTEQQKGESSDSFKRACVNFGIGRELYTAPFIYIKNNDYLSEYNGKLKLKSNVSFSVKEIEYNEFNAINKIIIIDNKNNIVFKFENKKTHDDKKEVEAPTKYYEKELLEELRLVLTGAMAKSYKVSGSEMDKIKKLTLDIFGKEMEYLRDDSVNNTIAKIDSELKKLNKGVK